MKRLVGKFRRPRGFTLQEVLVPLAILAIIAGIAVPVTIYLQNSAKTKAAAAELVHVQSAVNHMMTEENLDLLPNYVISATNDMAVFPDWESNLNGGYVLIPTDAGNDKNVTDTDWIIPDTTAGTYTCAANGIVAQETTGY